MLKTVRKYPGLISPSICVVDPVDEFYPGEHFLSNIGPSTKVKIRWVNGPLLGVLANGKGRFERHERPHYTVEHKIDGVIDHEQIAQALGGSFGAESSLWTIWFLLGSGSLPEDSELKFFYHCDIVIRPYWCIDGWCIDSWDIQHSDPVDRGSVFAPLLTPF